MNKIQQGMGDVNYDVALPTPMLTYNWKCFISLQITLSG